ncbi:MAG: alpha/beta fold hydrolase [Bacteroidetes bacterium]|jgi:pimeloyl-ACP methyl ester carboxylesterase|nr:alpha/beta fold hydrolase [Bacteroidota bacterium]
MQLHSTSYGDTGPHVVMLHGLFGMSDNLHLISTALAERVRVLAVDLRNHGRSPHDPVMTYDAMAQDVVDLMDARGIPAAVVVGHSMGGKVAMEMALRHPAHVAGVAVVDIAPRAYPPHHDEVFAAFESIPLEQCATRKEVEDAMRVRVSKNSTALFLLKNLTREENGRFRWKVNVPVLRSSYHEINRAIDSEAPYDGPALFIRGVRQTTSSTTTGRRSSGSFLGRRSRRSTGPATGCTWMNRRI